MFRQLREYRDVIFPTSFLYFFKYLYINYCGNPTGLRRLRELTESSFIRSLGVGATVIASPNDAVINRNAGVELDPSFLPAILVAERNAGVP